MFGLDFYITNFKVILGQILARALMLIEYSALSVANIKKIVIKLIITKIKGIHSMITQTYKSCLVDILLGYENLVIIRVSIHEGQYFMLGRPIC